MRIYPTPPTGSKRKVLTCRMPLMSRPTSGVGEGLFVGGIVYVAVNPRQMDVTKPVMMIGPDGIAAQRLPKPVPWSMIERVDIPQAGQAG
ncbi:hypothetical protein IE4803_CH02980 [Rhizobium etli bv. phaseoli str. IE4803]|nr:hypothetical protein IE4803_CH02980 [Rhizobium etli bv. phaseoli str. IE4803]